MEGVGVFLLSERGGSVLRGRPFEVVAGLLDGRLTPEGIVERAGTQVSVAEAYYALMELEARGYLAEATDGLAAGTAALWHSLGLDAERASDLVRAATVTVRCLGDGDANQLVGALREHGIQSGEAGSLTLWLTDDYLHPEFAEVNADALRSGHPWLLVKPEGTVVWIGPLFIPGTTACWQCVAHRLRRNRAIEAFLSEMAPEQLAPGADRPVPAGAWAVERLVAVQVLRWLGAGSGSPLAGALYTYDPLELVLERHRVTRRPQCPACGDRELHTRQVARALVLEGDLETVADDGTRTEVVRSREALVSPVTGIVRRLGPVSDEGDVCHLYAADHGPLGRPGGPRAAELLLLSGRSGGKGTTPEEARASALGEAVERYSGVFQGDEPRVRSTLLNLGDRAIHPNTCLLFSDEQFRSRAGWNARGSGFSLVPVPFDPRAATDWTPVWSLTERRHKFLPTMLLYYGYPASWESAFCWADSNGSACGRTREEAIVRGFLELVERDSVALWWYNRLARPRLNVDTGHAYADKLTQWYQALGREVWVLDLTADFAIPCFAAVSRLVNGPTERILLGFGADFDPGAALTHALTEMNQMLATARAFEAGAGGLDPEVADWLRVGSVATHEYLRPDAVASVSLSSYRAALGGSFGHDVQHCERLVTERSMEMLVLDQTRPDIGWPAVKVIVPGLRPFWRRLAPGRLYDVPVALGWLGQPRLEAEINPVSIFF
jgi:ribosomal protein S12 methylthiotransferase accessory factor